MSTLTDREFELDFRAEDDVDMEDDDMDMEDDEEEEMVDDMPEDM